MAHFLGLILALFVWLAPVPAQASFPATELGTFDSDTTVQPKSNAFAFARAKWSETNYVAEIGWFNSTTYKYCRAGSASYCTGLTVSCDPSVGACYKLDFHPTSTTCPANSTLVNGSCTCNSGYLENSTHTACEAAPVNLCVSLLGKSAGTYNGPGGLGAKQLCITEVSSGDSALPGCRATGEATFGYESSNVGSLGVMYWSAVLAFDGTKCAPNPNGSTDASGSTPPAPPAPGPTTSETTQCPVGKVPGEVNGQTICVTPGTDTPQQAKKETNETEQKADGTTVEKTTSKQTVCDATKCVTTTTTTTTTTPPGGSASTTTETSTSTCVVGSPDCSAKAGVGGGGGGGNGDGTDPSSFGGTCSQAFTCKGDAIMCAVSLEQHKRNCALFVDSSPESILYGTEKTKTGAQYTSENVTISSSSFNSSNAFGGSAQCIQDKAVTVWGSQVVLPFSQICGTLAHLGTLLMSVSFLLAFRIVARG